MIDDWHDWRLSASCRQTDPEVFFVEKCFEDGTINPNYRKTLVMVREICAACPVLEECRIEAEITRPEWGIWAGERWTKEPVSA